MAERHLYNDQFEFEGSMDDNGDIYDARHRKIGHVEDGTIYDSCNIPRGHINADGQVTDLCNIPTGKEFGATFVGWGGHSSGIVRNDVLSTGHGNDYGIFSRVKDANRQYDMDNDNDDDDDDDYEDDNYDDGSTDDVHASSSRSRHSAGGRNEEYKSMSHDDPEASCVGCGCVALIVIGILIALRLYS